MILIKTLMLIFCMSIPVYIFMERPSKQNITFERGSLYGERYALLLLNYRFKIRELDVDPDIAMDWYLLELETLQEKEAAYLKKEKSNGL